MSERMPVEPEKAALNPDDDEPDVEGHVLGDRALNADSPVEKTRLNPDDDALDEGDEKARYKKF